jgi:UPF0755 protein
LYIHKGYDYEKVTQALAEGGFVKDATSFGMVARVLGIPKRVRPGKYKITRGMSNFQIARMLRAGRQTPVRLTIKRLRTKQNFSNLICNNLDVDSTSLRDLLQDSTYLAEWELDTNTAMCAIIPDTYEFYYNTDADEAFRKIAENYTKFWNDSNKQAAALQGLTPAQAVTVASIVEEETNAPEDKPMIASVYLNRVRNGMKLQADPTVKFAVGDFTIRRIAGPMLDNPSPYNTYKHAGLPPGPICTPSLSSVKAVLNAPHTTYLYFCAKQDFCGRSDFATTYQEQQKNARAYQQALDKRKIH